MNDAVAWQQAIALLTGLLAGLPAIERDRLAGLAASCRAVKSSMAAATLAAGGDTLCSDCGGECCLNGKYRMSGLDALVHLLEDRTLPVPDFSRKPHCPYGTDRGCLMEAELRPASCIQFICEALADRLPVDAAALLAQQEHELRRLPSLGEQLTGIPLGRPFLLLGEDQPGDRRAT